MIVGFTGGKALPKEDRRANQSTATTGCAALRRGVDQGGGRGAAYDGHRQPLNADGQVVHWPSRRGLQARVGPADRLEPAREWRRSRPALGRSSRTTAQRRAPIAIGSTGRGLWGQTGGFRLVYRRGTRPTPSLHLKIALVQDALQTTLCAGRRQHLHTRIAVAIALEERFQEPLSPHLNCGLTTAPKRV